MEAMRNRLPQFSLSTLLLLTTIAALVITTFTLWLKVEPLRREVRRLRDAVGELNVTDVTKPHAIEIDTETELHWRWLVWIPEGESHVLRLETKEIPAVGIPEITKHRIGLTGDGEELLVEYRVGREPNGNYVGHLTGERQLISHNGSSLDWVGWSRRIIERRGVGKSTQQAVRNEPLLLLRYRVSEKAAGIPQIEDPSAGIAIWISPE